MTDGSQPLDNNRHEAFALECAAGKPDADAWIAAGYEGKEAAKRAWDIRKIQEVAQRIQWLKKQTADGKVLSLQEKREFLAAVVRTPIGDIDASSPLCQSYKVTEQGTEYKAISKTDAIKIDNDMSGDNASQKHEVVVESREDWLRRIRGRKDDA